MSMLPVGLPSVFLAHGSPMLALDGGAWGQAVAAFGRELPPLRAILVCSAHWEAAGPFRLSSAERPGVLHDFGGFPEALYALDYPAPGAPDLAREAADLLRAAGLEALLDAQRPLDHGAWVPLRYLAPEADVPTSEHLDPLFVALGASQAAPETLYDGWQLGSLSLKSYAFR